MLARDSWYVAGRAGYLFLHAELPLRDSSLAVNGYGDCTSALVSTLPKPTTQIVHWVCDVFAVRSAWIVWTACEPCCSVGCWWLTVSSELKSAGGLTEVSLEALCFLSIVLFVVFNWHL